ncbi:MAG: hypothetical protein AAF393_00655 [Pseudomonadota bacterium]
MKHIVPAIFAVALMGSAAAADQQYLSETGQLTFGLTQPAKVQQTQSPAKWKAKPGRHVSQRQRTLRDVVRNGVRRDQFSPPKDGREFYR